MTTLDSTDPIAHTDQAKEEVKRVPPILGAYFRGLVAEGFQRCEALELCRDLQGEMIGGDDDD